MFEAIPLGGTCVANVLRLIKKGTFPTTPEDLCLAIRAVYAGAGHAVLLVNQKKSPEFLDFLTKEKLNVIRLPEGDAVTHVPNSYISESVKKVKEQIQNNVDAAFRERGSNELYPGDHVVYGIDQESWLRTWNNGQGMTILKTNPNRHTVYNYINQKGQEILDNENYGWNMATFRRITV